MATFNYLLLSCHILLLYSYSTLHKTGFETSNYFARNIEFGIGIIPQNNFNLISYFSRLWQQS